MYRIAFLLLFLMMMAAVLWILVSPLPHVAEDDAGHESFMRQAVPLLFGRKIKGYDEVKVLSDLAQLTSRETVIRALMEQPEYIDHWAEVLSDDLRIHREGFRDQTDCFGAPLRTGPDTVAVAQWILSHTPTSTPAPAFNMSDVLRSALKEDNLYPVYSAHLFAMESKPGVSVEQDKRHNLGATFGQVYLHREMLCLTCHNSEYSMSGDPPSGWNRTYPVPGNFERALYGAPEGEPKTDAFAMFRTDVNGGGTAPWGMQDCGTFKQSVPDDPEGITSHFIQSQGKQFTIWGVQQKLKSGYDDLAADGLQRTLPPEIESTCNFCASSCSGTPIDVTAIANNAPNANTVKNLLTNTSWSNGSTCRGCHGGSAPLYLGTDSHWADDLFMNSTQVPSLQRVLPGVAADSYLMMKLEGAAGIDGERMPRNANPLSGAQINQVRDWINGMDKPELTKCAVCPFVNCSQPKRYVAGTEAFAFLTAANAVNNVWSETFGSPLTIANYFPRNRSQRNALWNLTENNFIAGWSLKNLLVRILNSNYFNRKAPRDIKNASAYVVPPVWNPWTVADPRIPPVSDPGYVAGNHPENHRNAVGAAVRRYSARSLLNSVHEAVGWPEPQRFPPATGYPDRQLNKAIGQYFSDIEPGFTSIGLQSLLYWESVHGACTRPAGVGTDWIDRLANAITTFTPVPPDGPLTVGDVAVVMRDWLLGHGGVKTASPVDMSGNEADALAALFGVGSLNTEAATLTDLEEKLRGLCGVLIETPHFLLAGLAPTGLGPKPRLRVCNDGPCTYQEICEALKPAISSIYGFQGKFEFLACGIDSVAIVHIPEDKFVAVCPPGVCGLLPSRIPEGCYRELDVRYCAIEPPMCDPRCSTVDCCGGPLPPINQRERAVALIWADGASVRQAENVKILRRGGKRFEPLKQSQTLQAGELIVVPAGGKLHVQARAGAIKTPEEGLPEDHPGGRAFLLVTGEEILKQRDPEGDLRSPPEALIKRVRTSVWARHGEAGRPLTLEQFQSYEYPANEFHRRQGDVDRPPQDMQPVPR